MPVLEGGGQLPNLLLGLENRVARFVVELMMGAQMIF